MSAIRGPPANADEFVGFQPDPLARFVLDACFGKALREAKPSTRTGRAVALTICFPFPEPHHHLGPGISPLRADQR
ncbi:hypothetical protein [Nonomuraea sp. NPDC049141]|uniref:hypothetical protein n=1 Tax=Nonomuraea sp. NPDC049141 TaxID=3155500 RepID=UPI0033DFCD03